LSETHAQETGSRASRTKAEGTSDRRAQAIAAKLRNARRKSSLKLLKDDGQ
jgi:hypothetical protein